MKEFKLILTVIEIVSEFVFGTVLIIEPEIFSRGLVVFLGIFLIVWGFFNVLNLVLDLYIKYLRAKISKSSNSKQ